MQREGRRKGGSERGREGQGKREGGSRGERRSMDEGQSYLANH